MAMHPQRTRASLVLTFKVLQFVNQLRRRAKPPVSQGSLDVTDLGTGLKNLRSICNGLAKIRVSKTPKSLRSSTPNAPSHDAQHLLSTVDRKLSRGAYSFSAVAGDDRLLLRHSNALIFERCSLTELIQLLAAAQDALHVLAECRRRFGDDWLVAQGVDIGLTIDESFIANYEHMLVRLRTDLIDAMARSAFQELLQGGHDKRKRKMLSWFTEFAEKPQPLSTSFPWTIKPSLAVLWGVCWMFYDNNPDASAAKGGSIRVPLDKVLQNINLEQWDAPASSDYLDLGRQLIGTPPQRAAQTANTNVGLEHDVFQARNTGHLLSDLSPLNSRRPRLDVSQTGGLGPLPVRIHPPHPNRDTYYRGAQQLYPTYSAVDSYLPHNQGTTAAPLTAFSHLGTDNNTTSWHPSHSLPQDTSRRHHLVASPQNPSIRVTGVAGRDVYAQPHTDLAAFDHIFHPGHQPEAYPLNLDSSLTFHPSQYIMSEANISPATTAVQIPQASAKHERTSSINSIHGMPTPVSTSDPRSPQTPTADARTHILTSPQSNSRQISEDRSSLSGDDERKLNYSYKRNEEPERNLQGKMLCKHHDCSGLIFERKCEWSKHMDKHDRPYKCNVQGCEKLQGFTYSGGLLRHEREVHKMHGGTKKALFCPFHDCKRSSGAGFTRKENLAEHIRRVHRRTSMSADMQGLIIRRDTAMAPMEAAASSIAESQRSSESPYSRTLEYREDEEMSAKRKRCTEAGVSGSGTEELRAEIKRLRLENEEKDGRLQQLEQAVRALQQGRRCE